MLSIAVMAAPCTAWAGHCAEFLKCARFARLRFLPALLRENVRVSHTSRHRN